MASGSSEYVLSNGWRFVRPYEHIMRCYAKGRWCGRSVHDVFVNELSVDVEQFSSAVGSGCLTVNGVVSTAAHVIQHDQWLEFRMHRHEKPVLDARIEVLHDCSDYVVVDKPPSIPMHPAGRYNRNSLIHILRKEHAFPTLFMVNRLDKTTSGLVALAKNATAARRMSASLAARAVPKLYLARAVGLFPADGSDVTVDVPLIPRNAPCDTIGCCDDVTHPHYPHAVPAITVFRLLCYVSEVNESVVLCSPLTGRTHQIRQHLQYLGHWIVDDVEYARPLLDLEKRAGQPRTRPAMDALNAQSAAFDEQTTLLVNGQPSPGCVECLQAIRIPLPHQVSICLHAWKYEIDGSLFEATPPSWAASACDY
jgi:tRNA pseudouridine synthase 9